MTDLPCILNMCWRRVSDTRQTAVLHPDFWPIYKAEREELRSAGLTVGTDDEGVWHLRYDQKFDRSGAAELLPQLATARSLIRWRPLRERQWPSRHRCRRWRSKVAAGSWRVYLTASSAGH